MKTFLKRLFLRIYSFFSGCLTFHICIIVLFLSFSSFASEFSSVAYVLANTNNLLGESVAVRGVVLSVDRDGLSSVTYRVKLHDLLFCSVPVPSGAKWIGGKLSIYGRPVLSAGQSVIVKGVFTKRLSKYYIDPASISFY